MKNLCIISMVALSLIACKKDKNNSHSQSQTQSSKALPSFNESDAKENILNFVQSVTDKNSPDFVEVKNRIVVFDNDGTLWVEQPLPSQVFFAVDRVKEIAEEEKPDWAKRNPFKALVENDSATIKTFGAEQVIQIAGQSEFITDLADYDSIASEWVHQAKHPILQKNYSQLVYQPMLELLEYLRKNEFTIYIVSGGGEAFMRAWAPEIYGIEKSKIIGSTFKKEVVSEENSKALKNTTELDFYDDKEGKIISIDKHIAQKPIMIVGNSDGDLAMMEYATTDNPHKTLMVYLQHTDGEREFDYSKGVLAGTLEEGIKVAQEKGWTIIDMKTDWNTVFPD